MLPRVEPTSMPSETVDELDSISLRELHGFVLGLGRSLALAGAAVSETQERLTAVAAASGAQQARVVVLPTALIIAFGRAGSATIESIPQLGAGLRLDQISALYELVGEAERGQVEPAAGLSRLQRIRAMPARHGLVVSLMSYVAMTSSTHSATIRARSQPSSCWSCSPSHSTRWR